MATSFCNLYAYLGPKRCPLGNKPLTREWRYALFAGNLRSITVHDQFKELKKVESMGQRLRRLRKDEELTAVTVARRLGISVATYRRWESGAAIPGEPYVALAKILGVSLNELFGVTISKPAILAGIEEIEKILERMKHQE